ncbi:hypothetical protein D3C72_1751820 [compost metagenome]
MAGLDLHHGLVDQQVVARPRLDGQRGAHQLAGAVVAAQAGDAFAAGEVVAEVRSDDAGERFENGSGSDGGSRQYAGAGGDGSHDDLRILIRMPPVSGSSSPCAGRPGSKSDRMVRAFPFPKKGLNFHELYPFLEYKG